MFGYVTSTMSAYNDRLFLAMVIAVLAIPGTTKHLTLIQRRSNVFDVGPTLHKCYANVVCPPTGTVAVVAITINLSFQWDMFLLYRVFIILKMII